VGRNFCGRNFRGFCPYLRN